MKSKILNLLIVLGLVSLITFQSCREKEPCQDPRNPECENYNPCIDAKPVSAAFHMYENGYNLSLDPNWIYYDTDTSLYSEVRFLALEPNAQKYTWYIGNETDARTGQSVSINFASNRIPKRIRLIVQKEPNLRCFPTDDGVDTVDRMLYFNEFLDTLSTPVLGKFKGVSTKNPNVEMMVQIGYFYPANGGSPFPTFTGFNECTAYGMSGSIGFRRYTPWEINERVYLPNAILSERCNLFSVICHSPDNTDSIYVQYKQWSRDGEMHEFKGIKIK